MSEKKKSKNPSTLIKWTPGQYALLEHAKELHFEEMVSEDDTDDLDATPQTVRQSMQSFARFAIAKYAKELLSEE